MHSDALYRLTCPAAAPSFGHHIDRAIRHIAVRWPQVQSVCSWHGYWLGAGS